MIRGDKTRQTAYHHIPRYKDSESKIDVGKAEEGRHFSSDSLGHARLTRINQKSQ